MEPRRWLDAREQAAWRPLVAVLLRLPSAIERQLQRDAGLTHIEYLVLALLSEAPEGRLRLSHLAGQANTSLSRLSHVVTRLERRGWVERRSDPQDARATLAHLTAAGREAVVAAAPGHVELVRSLVFDGLTAGEVDALGDLCGTILARIDPHRGPIGPASGPPASASDIAEPEVEGDAPPAAFNARVRALEHDAGRRGGGSSATEEAEPQPQVEGQGWAQLALEVPEQPAPGP